MVVGSCVSMIASVALRLPSRPHYLRRTTSRDRKRSRHAEMGKEVTPVETFAYGFALALGMALIRFFFAR